MTWAGRRVFVTGHRESAENPALRLDSAKARDQLGWTPRWDLGRGLEETVAWYAAHACGDDARDLVIAQIEAFGSTPPASLRTR